ncbi:hypothetical protein Nepgr_009044 [Nepenthes gracilis]|uniref:Uncharacterized protein n=1 Tax=Nepenthes gracilis TaxID=150966 RepID=A0AAD3SA90_NEPGR|nr:hypothetical protein Nepgr_009044 [Nepenthes gracilis]
MHDASYLTCFGFLRAPRSSESVPDPFSPVSYEQGSPAILQGPREMAVQPSTNEGTCELVGYNSPVFFIHNIIRLPNVKPKIHIQDNWRIVDFFSHNPDSLHMFTFLFDVVGYSQAYKFMKDNLCCWICLDIISVGPEESAVPSDHAIVVLLEKIGTTDLCKGSFQRGIYTVELDVMNVKMHSLLKSPGKLFGLSTVPKFPQNPALKPGPNSSVFISSSISDVDEILGGEKFEIAWQYKKYFEEGEQTSDNRNNKLEYCNDCDLRKTWERHILTRKPIECVSMEDSTIDSRKLLDYEYVPNDTLHHVMDWVARRVSDFGLAKLALEADAHVSSREMGLDSFLVVRELAEQEADNGIFKMLRSDVTRFLTSILIGTTIANIGATALVIEAATEIFGEAGVSAATGVITVVVLLLLEINPTSIAVPNAIEVARFVVRPVLNFSAPPFPAPTFIMRYSATDVHNEIETQQGGGFDRASTMTIPHSNRVVGVQQYHRSRATKFRLSLSLKRSIDSCLN